MPGVVCPVTSPHSSSADSSTIVAASVTDRTRNVENHAANEIDKELGPRSETISFASRPRISSTVFRQRSFIAGRHLQCRGRECPVPMNLRDSRRRSTYPDQPTTARDRAGLRRSDGHDGRWSVAGPGRRSPPRRASGEQLDRVVERFPNHTMSYGLAPSRSLGLRPLLYG